MTDRELLEAAAKAAGLEAVADEDDPEFVGLWVKDAFREWPVWNPLTVDGDALRLAVKLGLIVDFRFQDAGGNYGTKARYFDPATNIGTTSYEPHALGVDEFSAARRAIVECAAAMVKP